MKIGIIGLGKMGSALAWRLAQENHTVYGYDIHAPTAYDYTITICDSIASLAKQIECIWIMVPAGQPVDTALQEIISHAQPNTIIIDGGNSKYTDSIHRAAHCKKYGLSFLDCGTSGGLHGKKNGFCLMIGGDQKAYTHLIPMWHSAAAPHGFIYTGPSGSGHYVKMVHNGIEYGILQAYAEGLHLLKKGDFKTLDIGAIADVWQHGSVIRSWLLELLAESLKKDAALETMSDKVGENGTGRWTLEAAEKQHIPTPVLKASLDVRAASQKSDGNYGTKIISLARLLFGGHVT